MKKQNKKTNKNIIELHIYIHNVPNTVPQNGVEGVYPPTITANPPLLQNPNITLCLTK